MLVAKGRTVVERHKAEVDADEVLTSAPSFTKHHVELLMKLLKESLEFGDMDIAEAAYQVSHLAAIVEWYPGFFLNHGLQQARNLLSEHDVAVA